MKLPAVFLALAVALAHPLLATDGVVEINQTRILASGGHFPYVISQPGSYRLTSNLDVTADSTNPATPENRTAIQIGVDGVSIDLNGFSILGPTSCAGGPPVTACGPTGTGVGVYAAAPRARISVRNGHIRGMGSAGISVFSEVEIQHVRCDSNGGAGFSVGAASLVEHSQSSFNGGDGLLANDGPVAVSNSVFKGNNGNGINAIVSGGTFTSSAFSYNKLFGISATSTCGYSGSSFIYNNGVSVGPPQTSGALSAGGNVCNASTTCP